MTNTWRYRLPGWAFSEDAKEANSYIMEKYSPDFAVLPAESGGGLIKDLYRLNTHINHFKLPARPEHAKKPLPTDTILAFLKDANISTKANDAWAQTIQGTATQLPLFGIPNVRVNAKYTYQFKDVGSSRLWINFHSDGRLQTKTQDLRVWQHTTKTPKVAFIEKLAQTGANFQLEEANNKNAKYKLVAFNANAIQLIDYSFGQTYIQPDDRSFAHHFDVFRPLSRYTVSLSYQYHAINNFWYVYFDNDKSIKDSKLQALLGLPDCRKTSDEIFLHAFFLTLPRCALNIIKLFTEYFPLLIADCSLGMIDRYRKASFRHSLRWPYLDDLRKAIIIFTDMIVLTIPVVIHYAAKIAFFLGSSITSPYEAYQREKAKSNFFGLLSILATIGISAALAVILAPLFAPLLSANLATSPVLLTIGKYLSGLMGVLHTHASTSLCALSWLLTCSATCVANPLASLVKESLKLDQIRDQQRKMHQHHHKTIGAFFDRQPINKLPRSSTSGSQDTSPSSTNPRKEEDSTGKQRGQQRPA